MDATEWMLAPRESWSERVLRLRVFIDQQIAEVEKRHGLVSNDLRGNASRQETTLVGQVSMLEGALRQAANQLRAQADLLLAEQSRRLSEGAGRFEPVAARQLAEVNRQVAEREGHRVLVVYWTGIRDGYDVLLGTKQPSELGWKE